MHNPSNMDRSNKTLRNLSWSLAKCMKTYKNYIVSGFRFNTQDRDDRNALRIAVYMSRETTTAL